MGKKRQKKIVREGGRKRKREDKEKRENGRGGREEKD